MRHDLVATASDFLTVGLSRSLGAGYGTALDTVSETVVVCASEPDAPFTVTV